MKNAAEMRTITENAIIERNAITEKRARQFMETKVMTAIEAAAQNGHDHTMIYPDANIVAAKVREWLHELGYETRWTGKLEIYW